MTLLAAVAVGVASGPAFSATLVVDTSNPNLECPGADYASINAAAAAAQPGDRITVCPGLYQESVTALKTLTFRGQGPHPRARSGDPTTETVLRYAFIGFDVLAPGVVIGGFTIEGAAPGIGVRTSRLFSGYRIEDNYFHRNDIDLTLQSNGVDWTVVEGNAFNNESDTAISASRIGITNFFGEAGTLANALIEGNLLTRHVAEAPSTPTAMQFSGTTRLSIAHNELVDGGEVLVTGAVGLTAVNNELTRSGASGIRVFASSQVRLLSNHVESSQGPGLLIADAAAGGDVVVAFNRSVGNTEGVALVRSHDVLVTGNRLDGNSSRGIRASFGGGNSLVGNGASENGTHGILVTLEEGTRAAGNVLSRNGAVGLLLAASTNGFFARNLSMANGLDGIRIDADSGGNEFVANRMSGNGELDCHDESAGAGTAGTANFWRRNTGKTESPPGLCDPDD